MAEVLGEGASGVIRKALWTPPRNRSRSSSTKAPSPATARRCTKCNACIAAGLHPNLIKVEGRVVGHPEGRPRW
jgi:hypothetical protein